MGDLQNEISRELEEKAISRVVEHAPALSREQVRQVFNAFRTLAKKPRAMPFGNRFLVGSVGADVAIMALEVRLERDHALNLVTWITLVAGLEEGELEAARTAAIAEAG